MRNGKPEPPPITITPTATPSNCLAEDYERARRTGQHVIVVEGMVHAGVCWCGERHDPGPGVRVISVTTYGGGDA